MRSYTASMFPRLYLAISMAFLLQGPQDYPQWRGIHRDGSASAFVEPKIWPATLTRRWKVAVGEGYATPIIVGNTVYTFTRVDENEVITALDATSGEERWHSGYPAPYTPSKAASAHGASPKATPTFHNGRLFTLGISGIVAAFDATTGKILWRTEPPAELPFFSAASSPVCDKDLVFAHPGNYDPLTAFDTKTGKIQWTAGDGGFFASPIIVDLAGVRQVITVTQNTVIGVSVADGTVLWQYPWQGGAGGTMPVMYRDTVIVSGLDQGVTGFTPSRREGKWSVEKNWETKVVSMYTSNPVVIGDALYGLSHRNSGQFFALDAVTGQTLWLGSPREALNAAIVKAGELLFLLKDDAELIVAKASQSSFEPITRYNVADSSTWAQPAISGNRLFVKDVAALALWTIN